MKQYNLEVQSLLEVNEDGTPGKIIGYFSKGHHDPFHFVRMCAECHFAYVPVTECHHVYYRVIPRMESHELIRSRPGRGAFPVTVYETSIV